MDRSDIILMWGKLIVPGLERVDFQGKPVVVQAFGACQWTRDLVKDLVPFATHGMAISAAAAATFPAHFRGRVRVCWPGIADGEARRRAVLAARAREDDHRLPVEHPASLEQDERAAAVDVEVAQRVADRVDVVHLAGQVEDEFLVAHQLVHRVGVADVGDVEVEATAHRLEVVAVGAVPRQEVVDDRDGAARVDEGVAEVPWDVKVRRGKLYMTSYKGNHYGTGPSQIDVLFKTSDDGVAWRPVDPGNPVVYKGGVSEVAFELGASPGRSAVV